MRAGSRTRPWSVWEVLHALGSQESTASCSSRLRAGPLGRETGVGGAVDRACCYQHKATRPGVGEYRPRGGRAGPAISGSAPGTRSRGGRSCGWASATSADDRERDLPDDRPPRPPVRGGCPPAPVPASFQPHQFGPGRRGGGPDGAERLEFPADAAAVRRQRPRRAGPPTSDRIMEDTPQCGPRSRYAVRGAAEHARPQTKSSPAGLAVMLAGCGWDGRVIPDHHWLAGNHPVPAGSPARRGGTGRGRRGCVPARGPAGPASRTAGP